MTRERILELLAREGRLGGPEELFAEFAEGGGGGSLPDPPPAKRREALERLEDEELVVRHLEEGDEHAFRVLADRYHDRLVSFLLPKVGDRETAEDLVQEGFLRVYRHLHRFDPDRKFSTWIYTIVSNLAKNLYRDRSRDPQITFGELVPPDRENGRSVEWADSSYMPDEMARERELREIVEETVDELPEHYRKVFALREMEGKSYEEIAEATGLKLGTVKSRLSRARSRFAELVSRRLEMAPAS